MSPGSEPVGLRSHVETTESAVIGPGLVIYTARHPVINPVSYGPPTGRRGATAAYFIIFCLSASQEGGGRTERGAAVLFQLTGHCRGRRQDCRGHFPVGWRRGRAGVPSVPCALAPDAAPCPVPDWAWSEHRLEPSIPPSRPRRRREGTAQSRQSRCHGSQASPTPPTAMKLGTRPTLDH